MSEAQLAKLQVERDALRDELQKVQSAMPVNQACQLLIKDMNQRSDPFVPSTGSGGDRGAEVNEWVSENDGSGGCCIVM